MAPRQKAQSEPVRDGKLFQTHRLPLPLVAVGIQLASESMTLHVLLVVEGALLAFAYLIYISVHSETLSDLNAFAILVAPDVAAQLLLVVCCHRIKRHRFLSHLRLAHHYECDAHLLWRPLHVELLLLSAA